MVCGPMGVGAEKASQGDSEEMFSFAQDTALGTSMTNMALLWSTPLRAAMVFASEAMGHRDGDR